MPRRPPDRPHSYREQFGPRYRRSGTGGVAVGCVGLIFVLVIVGIASAVVFNFIALTHHTVQTCTVSDKSMGFDKDGHGLYRVYTADCGVFEVEDAWYLGNYNSADLYASLQRGHEYVIDSTGFRNGFFSTFPTIVKVTPA